MLGDIDDLIRSNQGERAIISETINTLIDSALDVADLSAKEGELSGDQKRAMEGLEAGLVKLIKSDIVLEHNVTSLKEIREKIKRRTPDEDRDDRDDEDEEVDFKPAPEPTMDDIKEHAKYKEFFKRVWKKDMNGMSCDDGDDDDDDLAVVDNQLSLICPITKKTLVDPVKKYHHFKGKNNFIYCILVSLPIFLLYIARTAVTPTPARGSSSTSAPSARTPRPAQWLGAERACRNRR